MYWKSTRKLLHETRSDLHSMDGKFVKKIEIPLGEVASTSGKRNRKGMEDMI